MYHEHGDTPVRLNETGQIARSALLIPLSELTALQEALRLRAGAAAGARTDSVLAEIAATGASRAGLFSLRRLALQLRTEAGTAAALAAAEAREAEILAALEDPGLETLFGRPFGDWGAADLDTLTTLVGLCRDGLRSGGIAGDPSVLARGASQPCRDRRPSGRQDLCSTRRLTGRVHPPGRCCGALCPAHGGAQGQESRAPDTRRHRHRPPRAPRLRARRPGRWTAALHGARTFRR